MVALASRSCKNSWFFGNDFTGYSEFRAVRQTEKNMAKTQKTQKKAVKKSTAKKKRTSKKKTSKALTKYTLVPAPIKEKQLLFILQRTPKQHIYQRKAKGGGYWDYVTGVYVKKVLNYCFGWMWDFEIKEHGKEEDLVWVLGRLTIKNQKGEVMIVKEQFGRADIKFKNEYKTIKGQKVKVKTNKPLDYGNDLKAAATDALKKCASELGIASDVYGKQEFQEIQKEDKGFTPPPVEVVEPETEIKPVVETKLTGQKVEELKKMLKGKTDEEKIADLKKRTGITLSNGFNITEKHAGILIASVLNSETK